MKKITITLFCLALTAGAAHAQAAASARRPEASAKSGEKVGKFQFEEETHDFGKVIEGPHAECDFVFKNTGKAPIIIKDAKGSCGCTVPTWTHEPILPGKTSKIHVSFDTNYRKGKIDKDVWIVSNVSETPEHLRITGEVIPAPQVAPPPTLDGK